MLSARKKLLKVLGDVFSEPFPQKALAAYLGSKAVQGKDMFAEAVEISSAMQDIGNATGVTLRDGVPSAVLQWT